MVALRAQQAGAAGGGAVPAAGNSAKEASSFGPAVDQGHKSLAEMREERQVHPNMESVFWRTYSSPSALPSAANSAVKDADMHEDEICECAHCACVECACGGLERGCVECACGGLERGIIEGFDKRFGDGTHITEFREGHGRQPCGYTQVRCV